MRDRPARPYSRRARPSTSAGYRRPSCRRSFFSPSMVSADDLVGVHRRLQAERDRRALTRSAWRSRSGATPSNQRAPSKTLVPSHMAWLRGPRMATLPSCQSPSTIGPGGRLGWCRHGHWTKSAFVVMRGYGRYFLASRQPGMRPILSCQTPRLDGDQPSLEPCRKRKSRCDTPPMSSMPTARCSTFTPPSPACQQYRPGRPPALGNLARQAARIFLGPHADGLVSRLLATDRAGARFRARQGALRRQVAAGRTARGLLASSTVTRKSRRCLRR